MKVRNICQQQQSFLSSFFSLVSLPFSSLSVSRLIFVIKINIHLIVNSLSRVLPVEAKLS